MIRSFVRLRADLSYLESDPAHELDDRRDGPALWWPLGREEGRVPSDALSRAPEGRAVGYDLVVAAPRPASCLLAVGDLGERRAVVVAHREAVAGAIGFLDARGLVVRQSILGDEVRRPGRFGPVAAFTHGVNRAGEPHLHDHVIVAARTPDGRRALDRRELYAHLPAADALYRTALREGVARLTGRRAWRAFSGVEYVEGVDEYLRALWPGRAERRDKRVYEPGEADRLWAVDLERYERGPEVAPPRRDPGRFFEHVFAAELVDRGTLRRRDVVRALAEAATFGARSTAVETACDRWYPELSGREDLSITPRRALMLREIAEHGEREIEGGREPQSPRLERSGPDLGRSRR